MRELRSLTSKEIAGVKYVEKFNFDNGLLPVEKEIIEMMIFHLSPTRAEKNQTSKEEAVEIVLLTTGSGIMYTPCLHRL